MPKLTFIFLLFTTTFIQAENLPRIGHVSGQSTFARNYPLALISLVKQLNKATGFEIDEQPAILKDFADPTLFNYPVLYINYADRPKWQFSAAEEENLRLYLQQGGFIFIDAGINAEFLRQSKKAGQHHSFANWEITPEVGEAFARIFPEESFQPLKRNHPIYGNFYKGLPDPQLLPDTVRDFVIEEKWPDGTYSLVGLEVNDRLAVLASPILAMGWETDEFGHFAGNISMRIRESADHLDQHLKNALNSGDKYQTVREDGQKDEIFCQGAHPAWVHEANGNWRVFKYYSGEEISNYVHRFYTRLGINIFIYSMTH